MARERRRENGGRGPPRCFGARLRVRARLASLTQIGELVRRLPSPKNPHFQNEAKSTTFLVKMSLIGLKMKNHFRIKGWALKLVLIRRSGGTRKWPIQNAFYGASSLLDLLSIFPVGALGEGWKGEFSPNRAPTPVPLESPYWQAMELCVTGSVIKESSFPTKANKRDKYDLNKNCPKKSLLARMCSSLKTVLLILLLACLAVSPCAFLQFFFHIAEQTDSYAGYPLLSRQPA